jgi:choline dehydrogenase-like flavoprotein
MNKASDVVSRDSFQEFLAVSVRLCPEIRQALHSRISYGMLGRDTTSVVGNELKVYGIDGLRIADGSSNRTLHTSIGVRTL